jgi:hypothetical protein
VRATVAVEEMLTDRYPLPLDVERYIVDEQRLGHMLDYAVIVPRLQRLYEWSAEELGEPRLLELVREGNPDLRLALRAATRMANAADAVAARVLELATSAR